MPADNNSAVRDAFREKLKEKFPRWPDSMVNAVVAVHRDAGIADDDFGDRLRKKFPAWDSDDIQAVLDALDETHGDDAMAAAKSGTPESRSGRSRSTGTRRLSEAKSVSRMTPAELKAYITAPEGPPAAVEPSEYEKLEAAVHKALQPLRESVVAYRDRVAVKRIKQMTADEFKEFITKAA